MIFTYSLCNSQPQTVPLHLLRRTVKTAEQQLLVQTRLRRRIRDGQPVIRYGNKDFPVFHIMTHSIYNQVIYQAFQ